MGLMGRTGLMGITGRMGRTDNARNVLSSATKRNKYIKILLDSPQNRCTI